MPRSTAVSSVLLALLSSTAAQTVCYVSSTTGSDSNDCSSSSPLLTIDHCISRVGSGGTCYLSPGTYREASAYNGSLITGVSDLTIALAPSTVGEATIDGTIDLSGWEQLSDAHGTYFRSTAALGDSVWQIFVDGAPLTPARWPNALLWTAEWWSRGMGWAKQDTGSNCGTSVDNGTLSPAYGEAGHQSLAATGVSFNGCNVIMNNEHWKTRRYTVANHVAGTSTFTYANDANSLCTKYGTDVANNAYFIDGCVAAFDFPGEWVSDSSGHVLVRLPSGVSDISSVSITAKAQTYAFAFSSCHGLTLTGLSFFATTVLVYDSGNVTMRGNTWRYPSASRRALGGSVSEFDAMATYAVAHSAGNSGLVADEAEYEIIVPSTWVGRRAWTTLQSRLTFEDNAVYFSEGAALVCAYCHGELIHNNHIEHAGYPWARALQFGGTKTNHVTLSRNRIDYAGSGAIAWMWGVGNLCEYNHISHSGMLIVDNEGIQGGKLTSHATFRFNWVTDSKGLGLRFDAGEDGLFGNNNSLEFNVVLRNAQGGLAVKADEAHTYRNTGADNVGSDVESAASGFAAASAADMKICACYPADCTGVRDGVEVPAFTNIGSVTRGNVGIMSPGTDGGLLNPYDIPGTHDHNVNLALVSFGATDVRERRFLYRDYDNLDFRPYPEGPLVDAGIASAVSIPGAPATVGAAPDVGAYEHGSPVYWIPGRQYSHASSPVPPTGATGVLPDADLMFLVGKAAATHRVYMAGPGSGFSTELELVGELSGENNVFTPPTLLTPDATPYRWRVDAVTSDGTVTTGSEWNFTVACADVGCSSCGASPFVASCQTCDGSLTLSGGRCAPAGGCLAGSWSLTATSSVYASGASGCDTSTWTCSYSGVSGSYTDTFLVESRTDSNCANNGFGKLWITQNGNTLQGLSCDNNAFSLVSTFVCTSCEVGYTLDTSEPSGCAANPSWPRPPPSPPSPPPSPTPHSPPLPPSPPLSSASPPPAGASSSPSPPTTTITTSPLPSPPSTSSPSPPPPPPPSPSPSPNPPPPPPPVVLSMTASGSVSDYSDTTALAASIASLAGVDASLVTIEVTAGSVVITATIATPATTTAAAVESSLTAALSTADAASTALGITVEDVPAVTIAAPPSAPPSPPSPALPPPSPSPALPPPAGPSGGGGGLSIYVLIGAIAGGVVVLVAAAAAAFCMMKRPSSNVAPATTSSTEVVPFKSAD